MAKSYNSTHEVLNAAIDRLEEQLEDAREMPPWAIALVVMMSVIVACCLFQAMIFMIFGPIVLAYSRLRGGDNQRLLSDGEADNGGDIEIAPAGDLDEPSPRVAPKKHGKTKVTFKTKSGTLTRHSSNVAASSTSRENTLHDMEL